MRATTNRDPRAVPELVVPTPACPVCGDIVVEDPDGWACDDCGLTWSPDGQDGGYTDDGPVCGARHPAGSVCVLAPGHDQPHHVGYDPDGQWGLKPVWDRWDVREVTA